MAKLNPILDEYIAKAAPFAQPILEHIRQLVHTACPEVEEKMKWSFPHWDYKGEMMCSAAAFKQHCALNFWKGKLIKSGKKYLEEYDNHSMGRFGRITSLKDLPPDHVLLNIIKEACILNDKGIKEVRKTKSTSTISVDTPDDLKKALAKNKTAEKNFNAFPPSHRKEYIGWILDAKQETTRERRIKQTVELVAEGKGKNWKYEKK